jgi:hypothetical protein
MPTPDRDGTWFYWIRDNDSLMRSCKSCLHLEINTGRGFRSASFQTHSDLGCLACRPEKPETPGQTQGTCPQ